MRVRLRSIVLLIVTCALGCESTDQPARPPQRAGADVHLLAMGD